MPNKLEIISERDIEEITAVTAARCVSLYMDSSEFVHDPRQNATRLGNLVRKAEKALADDLPDWFTPLAQLADQSSASRIERAAGIAIFASENFFRQRALPFSPDDAALVQTGFNIRPLLPVLTDAGHYYVLAIDPVEPRLYRAAHNSMARIEHATLSETLDEIRDKTDFDDDVGFHATGPASTTGGTATPKYHAQGQSAGDYKEIQLDQFTLRLAKAVDDYLKASRAPLVVVSDPNLLGSYRKHATYTQLLDDAVDKNPSGLSEDEIHQATRPIAEPVLDQSRQESLANLKQLIGHADRYPGIDVEEVIKASADGRIDTLFVKWDAQLSGVFDESRRDVELHGEAESGGQDLVSFCLGRTLSQSGKVVALSQDELPESKELAAIFRY